MIKLATPISHLFADSEAAKTIINVSDCLECRDRTIENTSENQELFHCELEPIHQLSDEDFLYLKDIKRRKKGLKLITFHMATSCTEPSLEFSKIKSGVFELGGRSYSRDEMLENAKKNLAKIKSIFGGEIKIALENNNYYPTDAYRYITDADFITQVINDNDVYFLFDIAHAQVTAHNKGIEFEVYKNQLPLERVIQIHICSPFIPDVAVDAKLSKNIAYDAHNYPDEFKLNEVRNIMENYSTVQYLTVEYYRDVMGLVRSIGEVRKVANMNNH